MNFVKAIIMRMLSVVLSFVINVDTFIPMHVDMGSNDVVDQWSLQELRTLPNELLVHRIDISELHALFSL